MNDKKAKPWGKILASGILLLGLTLAISSRLYYNARHPAALEAHFSEENQVLAKFDQKHAAILEIGLPASISTGENGYNGYLIDQTDTSTFVIALDSNQDFPASGTPCRVVVDASIPPEFLKPRLPTE